MSRKTYIGSPGEKEAEGEAIIRIIHVEKNTVHLKINGCNVTSSCQEQDNTEIYNRIKEIMINAFLSSKSCRKI